MTVKLLYHTPLYACAHAIRMSHDNHDKSDSQRYDDLYSDQREWINCGPKDRALIERVGNKLKHASVLEHLTYIFDISDVSRALLQELARHRMASLTVKSTRYTLNELKSEEPFTEYTDFNDQEYLPSGYERACKYLVMTENEHVNRYSILALDNLRDLLVAGISNDVAKYALPESYKVRLQWTINARSLQNFLQLRSSKDALWEIRLLAAHVYKALPSDHQYLFTPFMKDTTCLPQS